MFDFFNVQERHLGGLIMGIQDKKVHYKMYKAGKLWLYSSIALTSFISVGMISTSAKADSTIQAHIEKNSFVSIRPVSESASSAVEATQTPVSESASSAVESAQAPVSESASSAVEAVQIPVSDKHITLTNKILSELDTRKSIEKMALIQGSILDNVTVTNNSGTVSGGKSSEGTALKNDSGSKDIDFNITGNKPVESTLIGSGNKVFALSIPKELVGKVTLNGQAAVSTSVSVRLDQVPILSTALSSLQVAVNTFNTSVSNALNLASSTVGASLVAKDSNGNIILGSDGKPVNGLQTTVAAINNLLNDAITVDQSNFNVVMKLGPDGNIVSIDLNDGLGQVLQNKINDVLTHIQDLIVSLEVYPTNGYSTNPLLAAPQRLAIGTANTTLSVLKGTLGTAVTAVRTVINAGTGILGNLASVSLLGDTQATLPLTINTDGLNQSAIDLNKGAESFNALVTTGDIININIFNGTTDSTNVYFDVTSNGSTPDFVADEHKPTIDPMKPGSDPITGTGTPGDTIVLTDKDGKTIGTGT
ncbi:adhesive domain-containing protein, partial [Weissella sp. MSCH1]|uniref:adhesive domain-containing protein n=1 Tax=Weissella sp. MSCH1 TaxID=3383343 RepID=UPI003896B102